MRDRVLSRLGLCRKAGKLIYGFVAAAEAIRGREAILVVTAKDLSPKSKKEIEFIAAKDGIEVIPAGVTMDEIEQRTGKRAGILAVTDSNLAEFLKCEIGRADKEE